MSLRRQTGQFEEALATCTGADDADDDGDDDGNDDDNEVDADASAAAAAAADAAASAAVLSTSARFSSIASRREAERSCAARRAARGKTTFVFISVIEGIRRGHRTHKASACYARERSVES